MFCRKCGKEIVDESVYCAFCGAEQTPEEEQKEVPPEDKRESPPQEHAEEPPPAPHQRRSFIQIVFIILVCCLGIVFVVFILDLFVKWMVPEGKKAPSSSAPALSSSQAPSVSSQKKEPVELKQGDIGYNVFHSLIGSYCTDFSVYELPDDESSASPSLEVSLTVEKESIDNVMSHCFSVFSFYLEEEWPYNDITVNMDGMGVLFLTLGEPSSWTSFLLNSAEDEEIKSALDTAYQKHFSKTDLLAKAGL